MLSGDVAKKVRLIQSIRQIFPSLSKLFVEECIVRRNTEINENKK